MVVFPNCKINLGLYVTEKRSDGFHNLETIFIPITVKDALEIIVAESHNGEDDFQIFGDEIAGDPTQNICLKALQLLRTDFPRIPFLTINLLKKIPSGAGLGGGSADGAFMLQLINQQFSLGISQQRLVDYALKLGSDCPFFILNKPCFAKGRGEMLYPIDLNITAYKIVLVNPKIHISTAEAFADIEPQTSKINLEASMLEEVKYWEGKIENQFEKGIFRKYPDIENIKTLLIQSGALYASMSGTGSTVFGIFKKDENLKIVFPSDYWVQTAEVIY